MDPRTAQRIKEENEKSAAKMRANRASKRPRSPEGWQLDAEDLIRDLNRQMETVRFDVPNLLGLDERACMAKLNSVNKIKKLMDQMIDEAKTEFYLRDQKRPAGCASNPDEVPQATGPEKASA